MKDEAKEEFVKGSEALRRDEHEELDKYKGLAKNAVSLLRDVTERREAEERLLQSPSHFIEVTSRHTEMAPLLGEFVTEVKKLTGCAAVAIRILDEEGNIPYQAGEGFSQGFWASPLSVKSDRGMCVSVVNGVALPEPMFYTEGGSFYVNNHSNIKSVVKKMGGTCQLCHQSGYRSLALVPIRFGANPVGLIHLADPAEDMVPLPVVEALEVIALELGAAIGRVRAEEALRVSEARFLALAQTASEAIISVDRRANIILWNHGAETMFGYAGDEMVGKPFSSITPERFREALENEFKWMVLLGQSQITDKAVELVGLRKGGGEFSAELSLARWEVGKGVFFTAVIRDVSGRSQTEETLRETRSYLNGLLGSTKAPIMVWDKDQLITAFNGALEQLTGYVAAEVIGQPLSLLLADETEALDRIAWPIGGERGESVEMPVRGKDGTIQAVRWELSNIFDSEGGLVATMARGGESNGRRQAKKVLPESEKRYCMLVENLSDVIWSMDMKPRFTYISPAVKGLLGYSVDELMELTVADILTPASLEVAMKALAERPGITRRRAYSIGSVMVERAEEILASICHELVAEALAERISRGHHSHSRPWTLELELNCRDGSLIFTETVITFRRDSEGRPVEILGVTRDITKRRREEATLKETAQEPVVLPEAVPA